MKLPLKLPCSVHKLVRGLIKYTGSTVVCRMAHQICLGHHIRIPDPEPSRQPMA